MAQPVFRFAPSPNGLLHVGHAHSALMNERLAGEAGGRLLLRLEDIDRQRCPPHLLDAAVQDLAWLGLRFEAPVMRQSAEMPRYAAALEGLLRRGLVYRCSCSRQDIANAWAGVGTEPSGDGTPLRDPDGAPLYPGMCRHGPRQPDQPLAWRLDMSRALDEAGRDLAFEEIGPVRPGRHPAQPELWGDVVLGRKDFPASYHLAVVLDDAAQGVTHVVRGMDLFAATGLHRLLQALLGLPAPIYHHHALILDADGRKLSKSLASTSLRALAEAGEDAGSIRARLGFAGA